MADRKLSTRTVTGTALLLALGVALPLVFHAFPFGGRMFLPMHIPALLAGLLLGPISGLIVGAGSPVLSALATGRPTIPYMVPMVFELATYGAVAGILRPRIERFLASRRRRAQNRPVTGTLLALAAAMIAGRAVWLAVAVLLAPLVGIKARSLVAALAALGAGWMGMLVQLFLIPAIVRAVERSRNP